MNRKAIYIAAALTAALAAGAMAGCSSQPASSASASASSASVEASASAEASSSAAPEQTQAEIIAELKAAIAGTPAFKTVTVEEEAESIFEVEDEVEADDASAAAEASDASASAEASEASEASASAAGSQASAEPEKIVTKNVYKFDESGSKPKTNMVGETGDFKVEYYTEGRKAVLVTDGTSYSGKVKQFGGLAFAKGFQAYLADDIGDLNTLVDCAANVEKTEQAGLVFYMVTVDPVKYIAADEILGLMKELGDPLTGADLSLGFDESGNIASIDFGTTYERHAMLKHLVISDYDSTVVAPMPAADKTYKDMKAEIQEKVDAFTKELGLGEDSAETASSSAAAKAE